ncbi:uncharacterized protein LOC128200464 [Galleria mellonella]|uniref:Uncharacterized protein LOC128200464 n=1 Tax=Galleria mellonella TaxID=7137 RepID=A0ABM3MFL5_GALME|nr:uncharacterized protein LOC128200464 [Galleria mellonella]
MDEEFITMRRQRSNSLPYLDLSNITVRSAPNASLEDSEETAELKQQIEALNIELKSAHTEIENLLLENKQLTLQLQSKDKINKLYKEIESGTSTPISKRKHSIKSNITSYNMLEASRYILDINKKLCTNIPRKLLHTECTSPKLKNQDSNICNNINILKSLPNCADTCKDNPESNISASVSPSVLLTTTKKKLNVESIQQKKVIIMADEQGRGLRQKMQNLLGSQYKVHCTFKPGARLSDIIGQKVQSQNSLTENDYIIVLGGIHDKNPYECISYLYCFLNNLKCKANVLIGEIPKNFVLNERKLNSNLKMICNQFKNVTFINMDFSRYLPYKNYFTTHISQRLLKDILMIDYKIKYNIYMQKSKNNISSQYKNTLTRTSVSQSTQTETEYVIQATQAGVEYQNENENSDTCFRL